MFDSGGWHRSSPFSIIFFIRSALGRVRGIFQLVAMFGALAILARVVPNTNLAIALGLLVVATIGALQYWFFRYRIEKDRILIRQGIFRKTSLDLPFDRIQGINITRSLTDRLLGLVTVTVDSAGSEGVEGQIPAIRKEVADVMRGRVAAAGRPPSADGPESASARFPGLAAAGEGAASRDEAEGEVLLRLKPGDLVRIGLEFLADYRLPLILLVVALADDPRELYYRAATYFGVSQEAVQPPLDWAESAFTEVEGTTQTVFLAGILSSIFVGLAGLAIYSAFRRYHGFTLWREGSAYRTRGGLFSQREVVIESTKIQEVMLSQNLMTRWFRRYRLSVYPASDELQVLVVPLLGARLAESMRSELFGREGTGLTLLPQSGSFVRVSRHYIRAAAIKIGVLPGVALPALVLPFTGPTWGWAEFAGIWLAAWVLVGGLIAVQRWRRLGYMHDDDGMAIRGGFIDRDVDAFLFRKAQSVEVRQSPLQRLHGLATLEIELAPEWVMVPYIDHRVACRLRDYILYKVEASRRRWH